MKPLLRTCLFLLILLAAFVLIVDIESNEAQADVFGPKLQGWWTFDSNQISGTTVIDTSGQGNNGTMINSPVADFGRLGQARTFNGTNQDVKIYQGTVASAPAALKNFGNGDRTITAWIKTTQVTSAGTAWICTAPIIEARSYSDDPPYAWGMGVASNKLCMAASIRTNDQLFGGATAINDGKWHFVAATLSGTSVTLYLDGKVDGTGTQTFSTNNSLGQSTANNAYIIGARSTDAGAQSNFFKGTIDDLRLYNVALSANDIAALYYQGFGGHQAF